MSVYRVLLVDDEATSLRYFRNIIEAYVPRLQIVAEAENGLEAARLLDARKPDLLITDIRMPGMDGIALAKRARAGDPDILIIIVSGYSEFQYAKSAITLGVEDYLLKPLNLRQTVGLLETLCAKLDAAYSARRHDALLHLLAGQPFADARRGQLFPEHAYRMTAIRAGNLPARRALPTWLEPAQTVLPSLPDRWLLPARDASEMIVMQPRKTPPEETIAALEPLWAEGMHVTAVTKGTVALSDLRATAVAALAAIDAQLVIGLSRTMDLDAGLPDAAPVFPRESLRKLRHCLAASDYPLLKDTLFTWAVEWERRQLTQRWVEAAMDQIAECALSALPALQSRRVPVREELAEVFQVARTLGEVASGAWDILFSQSVRPNASRHIPPVSLDQVRTYIREHCAEPLSMQSVSAAFGVSQTFLGRMFRREADTTFGDCLTDTRMALARELIGRHPDMKLKDVAQCAGYEDPSYFTKVFTKHHGMTPSQFARKVPGPDFTSS